MISLSHVSKKFGSYYAVNDISVDIQENQVFGLIGTNGAGKSTALRMIAGVYQPDTGKVTVDDNIVYDNPKAKELLFFIPDEPYFFNGATAADMEKYYRKIYKNFSSDLFYSQLQNFGLESKRKIATYSKGMKKQLAILLGIYSNTKYLLCDETFDGLDPVMRQGVKSIFASQMERRGLTPIIASHNLRELEDICDHVGLMHQGGVLLSKDMEDMKTTIQKVQCVFKEETELEGLQKELDIIKVEKRGMLYTFTVRATREEVLSRFEKRDTVFFEVLPLSLEEMFISETEVVGYDIKKLILG